MMSRRLERSQHSEFDYRLRLYRDVDNKEVQALYFNAMIWQSHAPLVPFLKLVATTTVAKFLYLMSIFGAVIWLYCSAFGLAVFLTAGGTALLQISLAFQKILFTIKQNIKDDLTNVTEYYMLVPDVEAYRDLKTSGPRGFWIVEAKNRVTGKRELAGCGGLEYATDIKQRGGRNEAELRRLVVSNRHTCRGVAAMVIKAAVAHAKAHDLSSICLTTSSVQGPAIELYKKHGWIEEERQEVPISFGARMHDVFMRLYLEG